VLGLSVVPLSTIFLLNHDFTPKIPGEDTCYYFDQECGDLFDRIGKCMLKRVYVCRSRKDKRVCSICVSIISLFETWLSKVDIYFYVDMFY
jgi:hypothetical protein